MAERFSLLEKSDYQFKRTLVATEKVSARPAGKQLYLAMVLSGVFNRNSLAILADNPLVSAVDLYHLARLDNSPSLRLGIPFSESTRRNGLVLPHNNIP